MADAMEMSMTFDFLGQLESELAESRAELTRVIERTQALADLRSRAIRVQGELRRPITEHDVLKPRDEEDRAWLDLLVTRITDNEGSK
jgi:hypothetical protein